MHVALTCGILDFGGVERNVLQLAGGLPPDVAVSIWTAATPGFQADVDALDRPVDVVPLPPSAFGRGASPRRLARAYRDHGVDVVHTHDTRARLYAHLAARLAGARTVHTCHMSPMYYPGISRTRRTAYALADRATRRLTDAHVFVSDHERALYEAAGLVVPGRAVTIHNGVALDAPSPDPATARAAFDLSADDCVVVFTGRLEHQKGLDVLLEAARHVAARAPAFRLLIVGDGTERDVLAAEARRTLGRRVLFTGRLDADGVARALATADVFVLPSRFECFPYSTLEAFRAGLPCVVTDVGGNREAVEDGVSGAVVPPGDPDALANALLGIVTDAARRHALAAAAGDRARQFTVERMVARTAEVYASVAGGRPVGASSSRPRKASRTSALAR